MLLAAIPANLAPALLPFDSTPEPDLLVPDELPQDADPAMMAGKISIELIRNLIELP